MIVLVYNVVVVVIEVVVAVWVDSVVVIDDVLVVVLPTEETIQGNGVSMQEQTVETKLEAWAKRLRNIALLPAAGILRS